MDSKKKMIIALSSLAVVILATVVVVVSVLAAQTVTINSSITVEYTASEIAGKVTAKYKVANGSEQTIGSKEYLGTEAGGTPDSLTAGATSIRTLTSTNNYVDFIFTFTNTGSREYTATVTLPATITNFDITYTVPTGVTKLSDTSFKVAGGTETAVTYIVRMAIHDVAVNASINGTFSWTLS